MGVWPSLLILMEVLLNLFVLQDTLHTLGVSSSSLEIISSGAVDAVAVVGTVAGTDKGAGGSSWSSL